MQKKTTQNIISCAQKQGLGMLFNSCSKFSVTTEPVPGFPKPEPKIETKPIACKPANNNLIKKPIAKVVEHPKADVYQKTSNKINCLFSDLQTQYSDIRLKNMGIYEVDPDEYRKKYKFTKTASTFPKYIQTILDNECFKHQNRLPELEGDLEALKLIDLDKEGLSGYKSLLYKL